jgi:hypothetical protein
MRAWRAANRVKYNWNRRSYNHGHKLSREDFLLKYAAQDGACAICGRLCPADGAAGLHIDHDHVTGTIRGLLCSLCNNAVGLIKENSDVALKMAEYISSWQRAQDILKEL